MKTYLRLPGKIRPEQRSAVSYKQSALTYQLPAKYLAANKAYYLRPFLLLILVFVSCGAVLAQESVVQAAPAAKAEVTKPNFLIRHLRYLACFVLLLFLIPVAAKGQNKQGSRHEYVTNERTINHIKKITPDADLDLFPLIKYNPDYSGIEGLKIGDLLPDELWDIPLWVVNHPEGKDTIRLREYENEKLLVLDFWAKWCSPCVESMNNWNEYAVRSNGDVKVIGIHLDYDYKALIFSKEKGWDIPSVVGNKAYIVNRYFFNRDVISRMAWIKDGKLLAITNVKGYNFDTVQKVLNNEAVTIPIDSNWTYFNTNTLNQ